MAAGLRGTGYRSGCFRAPVACFGYAGEQCARSPVNAPRPKTARTATGVLGRADKSAGIHISPLPIQRVHSKDSHK